MTVLSAFSPNKPQASTRVGSPEYVESVVRFSPDGNMYLEQGAIRNRQNEINSYKAACDVNLMIRRYENGDQTALLRDNTGAYVDLSTLPKNIHEADKLKKRVHDVYSSIDPELKFKYRDVDEFLCAFSTESNFNEFCGVANEVMKKRAVVGKQEKEVKSDA